MHASKGFARVVTPPRRGPCVHPHRGPCVHLKKIAVSPTARPLGTDEKTPTRGEEKRGQDKNTSTHTRASKPERKRPLGLFQRDNVQQIRRHSTQCVPTIAMKPLRPQWARGGATGTAPSVSIHPQFLCPTPGCRSSFKMQADHGHLLFGGIRWSSHACKCARRIRIPAEIDDVHVINLHKFLDPQLPRS